jgi:hypothetical protein
MVALGSYVMWLVLAAIINIFYPGYPGFWATLNTLVIILGVIFLRGLPFIVAFLSSMGALVTGAISLTQIKRDPQSKEEVWIVIVGMFFAILGIFLAMALGAYVAFLLWGLSRAHLPF